MPLAWGGSHALVATWVNHNLSQRQALESNKVKLKNNQSEVADLAFPNKVPA